MSRRNDKKRILELEAEVESLTIELNPIRLDRIEYYLTRAPRPGEKITITAKALKLIWEEDGKTYISVHDAEGAGLGLDMPEDFNIEDYLVAKEGIA